MILVTGGCGVLGSRLVKRLLAEGNSVRVLALAGDPAVARIDGCDIQIRYGDVAQAQDLAGICDGVTVVLHLAAVIITSDETQYETVNVQGTANLIAEARKNKGIRFIYVSSASVVYPKSTAYSRSKRQAEHLVINSGVAYTIIRPTLVYDKGRGGQEFDIFLDYLNKWPVVPFIGAGSALKRPVYTEDVINGLVACVKLLPGNKIYNLSGGEAICIKDFARLCLRLMGKERRPIVSIPVWLCLSTAWFLEKFFKNPPLRWPVIAGIIQDANLDPAEAEKDLGYSPKKVSEFLVECFPREIIN